MSTSPSRAPRAQNAPRRRRPDHLPHPVTFFVTARQRTRILRALRAIHPDRAVALQSALGIKADDA